MQMKTETRIGMLAAISLFAGVFGGFFLYFKYKFSWLLGDIYWLRFVITYVRRMENFKKKNVLSVDIFEETVDKYDTKPMIIYKEQIFSFTQVENMANKVANLGLDLGLQQGDTVALLMYNEPAFVWTWFGFQKIGVKVAFLNFHQRKKVLLHSITSCEIKALFINQGKELYDAVDEIAANLSGVSLFTFETANKDIPSCFRSLSEELKNAPENRIPRTKRSTVTCNSTNCYVFTSGTTGLPKPAIVSNMRSSIAMFVFDYLKTTPDDILYECLPLYHSSGSLIGIGHACAKGITVVLSEKFSASRMFEECHKHNVTLIHYVGEMCRYLVNSPQSEFDCKHKVRGAIGNGLRKDVWNDFKNRFRIKDIVEFYGATELPFGLANLDNVVGSVGKLTPLRRALIPGKFIKFDTDKEEPYRDGNGRCVLAKDDEPGLFVVKVEDRSTRFDGYKNKDATERKLMHDVFSDGDLYVNSGDLFYIDADKDVYFYDRLGDTYRWKGENVSTNEVSNIISELPFIADTCVYGVTVPGCEGKAGMATINLIETAEQPTDEMVDQISSMCVIELTSYAIPRFLRFKKFLDITSTFKQIKGTLKREGYDIINIRDSLFFFNLKTKKYEKLTEDVLKKINAQEINL